MHERKRCSLVVLLESGQKIYKIIQIMRNREIERVPFRSKLVKFRNIENRNKVFKTLTKADQRKEIAFDALKLVYQGSTVASVGSYWGDKLKYIRENSDDSKELQNRLLNLEENQRCTVCQRGLMMVSQIRLANGIDPMDSGCACGDKLNIKGFTMKKFFEMEREYEGREYKHPYMNNTNQKLANICCNVIANGDFKTTDKTDYLKLWKLNIN